MSVSHSIPKKKRFANRLPVYPAFLKESLAKNFLQSFALPLGSRPAGRRAVEDLHLYSEQHLCVGADVLIRPTGGVVLPKASLCKGGAHYPGFAPPGGVRTAQLPSKFRPGRAQWPEARTTGHSNFARRIKVPSLQEDVPPVNRGPGKGDFERPLRVGAHRSRPPTHLWLLSGRAESNTRPHRNKNPTGFPLWGSLF